MFEVKRAQKGISAMIAEVIVVALALILIVSMVTWITGLWNTTRDVFIMKPLLHISYGSLSTEPVLKLYVTNKGQSRELILRVEIKIGDGYYVNRSTIEIPAGFSGYIEIRNWETEGNPKTPEIGDRCRVIIYTENHGTMFYDILVTS